MIRNQQSGSPPTIKNGKNKKATILADSSLGEKPICISSSNNLENIITYCYPKSKQNSINMFNILLWCDEKITYLKENNIKFDGIWPTLDDSMLYKSIPYDISPYKFLYDIPHAYKSRTLITFYSPDVDLFKRLKSIDNDIEKYKNYAGITGFDLSPSIFMLSIRQNFNLFVNAIYDCYVALHGIKILPNGRIGNLNTFSSLNHFPDNCSFIIGELGCQNNGFKVLGYYFLRQILKKKRPNVLYVYGGLPVYEAKKILSFRNCKIIVYPDRNSKSRHNMKPYSFEFSNGKLIKAPFDAEKRLGGADYGS